MRPEETEVAVVGGGPAGLVVASRLARAGRAVVLVESGLEHHDRAVQDENRGRVVGDPYADLRSVRLRQLGGTVHTWNTAVGGRPAAKYVPLDPIDLDARGAAGTPGWPLAWNVLLPWYEEAQRVCGLGPFEYGARFWSGGSGDTGLAFEPGAGLEPRVYQLGLAEALWPPLVDALREDAHASIECGLTAERLELDASGERARALVVRESHGGQTSRLRARTFVLATGAIENARLLLASGASAVDRGWLGRGFMEHPRDDALCWHPDEPAIWRDLAFYDQHRAEGGVPVLGRLGFDADCLRRRGLTNGSVTLFPRLRSRRGSWRRLAGRLGLGRGSVAPSGAGWSRQDPGRAELQGVQLLLNLEQAPQRDNAVRLSPPAEAGRDGPVRLEWRWRPEDQQRLEGLRRIVTEAFAASGLGRVERTHDRPPDPNAHHHAGTTRMSADPAEGVVDPDGRMHGLENVYCAGASVFPGAGFANPTLTIVALALRLAMHLAR